MSSIAKKKFKKTLDKDVWQCQVKKSNGQTCNALVKQDPRSTSNLIKHLNDVHDLMYKKMKDGVMPIEDEVSSNLLETEDPNKLLTLFLSSSSVSFNALNNPFFRRFDYL